MTPGFGRGDNRLWYQGWNIVAACVLAGIASSALPINAFSLFLQDWSAQLRAPISTLQIGIGACGLGCALLSPFVGVLADKYPARLLFAIGLAGTALLCFGISLMNEIWQYLVLYALLLPVAILLSTALIANAVVSRWFVRRLGLALSITAFGLSMAGVVMPPIVAATMPDLGWRGIWRTGGIINAVIILPLVIAVLRDCPTERDGLDYLSGKAAAVASHAAGVSGDLRLRDIFARRNFWLLIIVYLPMLAVYGGCGQNVAPIATSRGLSQHTAGVLLSLLNLSQLGATLIVGLLSDRFGNRLPLAGLAFATALEFGAGAVGRVFGLVTFFLPATVLAPFAVAKAQEMTGSYTPALLVIAVLTVMGGAADARTYIRSSHASSFVVRSHSHTPI